MTGTAKPWRSGPLQATHRIPNPHREGPLGSFTLRLFWTLNDEGVTHWVDFELFEVASHPAEDPTRLEYERKGASSGMDTVESMDEAQPLADGFVKWDGCTQFNVAPVHVDSRRDLENLFHGISEARRLCAAAMPDTYDRSGEYP